MQSYLLIKQQSRVSLILLFLIACIICIVTICRHEMWRDESQAFLIARDSKNLADLWQNIRYEGHPALWHFILYIAYHLFPSIYTMQVIHTIIGLSLVALIVFQSPFSFSEKSLLTFSYFFSFEYLIISRNYSIGILLLFLAIIIYNKSKSKNWIILTAIILGLCANSNIYHFIISTWLFIYFIFKSFRLNQQAGYKSLLLYTAILIFSLFLTIALLQLLSPSDRTPELKIATGLNLKKIDRISREISEALFYVPHPFKGERYWGSSIFRENWFNLQILNQLFLVLPQLLAFTMIIVFLLSLKKSPPILFFFTASFVSLFLFMYIIFDKGLLRHTGAFFVLLVTALWLYRSSNCPAGKSHHYFHRLFKSLLVMQLAGSFVVHINEIKYPFSGAKDAASFLIKSHRNNSSIILHPDFEGMSLLHYAGIKQVYYATIQGNGSFIKFNKKRKAVSYNDVYYLALRENIETMIFNGRKNDSLMNKIGYKLVYESKTLSTVPDEDFYIYGKQKDH